MALPFILPANAPFKAYKGANFSKAFQWVTRSGSTDTPVDITGYAFRAQIRERYISEESVLDLTSANGRFNIITAAEGRFSMDIDYEDMAAIYVPLSQNKITDIPYKDFVIDIEALPPAGADPLAFLKGVWRLYEEVTRDDL